VHKQKKLQPETRLRVSPGQQLCCLARHWTFRAITDAPDPDSTISSFVPSGGIRRLSGDVRTLGTFGQLLTKPDPAGFAHIAARACDIIVQRNK
jgi:hypothetical protein